MTAIRSSDLRDGAGDWHCPACGGAQFTVRELWPGAVVLACWRCPTFLRILPGAQTPQSARKRRGWRPWR